MEFLVRVWIERTEFPLSGFVEPLTTLHQSYSLRTRAALGLCKRVTRVSSSRRVFWKILDSKMFGLHAFLEQKEE